jgi:hypothetical protein
VKSGPSLDAILDREPGPSRTAGIAAWFQSLYGENAEVPVLVGGAAVELYTGGAYRTGDLDFVGRVPDAVARKLLAAGFTVKGRHWVRADGQVYIELPGLLLEEDERAATIKVDEWQVLIASLEDILVDRLAAWTFWRSHVDGVNAHLLMKTQGEQLDSDRLRERARRTGTTKSLAVLRDFEQELGGREPTSEELAAWARSNP